MAINILDILKPPFGIRQNWSFVLVVPIRRRSVNSAKALGVNAIAGSANRILARDLTSFVVLYLGGMFFQLLSDTCDLIRAKLTGSPHLISICGVAVRLRVNSHPLFEGIVSCRYHLERHLE